MRISADARTFTLLCIFLLAATLAAYWPVLGNSFVDFDDPLYVTENAMLQQGLNLDTARWTFVSKYAFTWHPVTWLSLMTDFELYRLKPMGYHLTNLLLHIVNTILLFIVLTGMTRKMWSSAIVAVLFAVHPLHVESVAWISERKDVLSTFFFMLTLWAYARYTIRPRVGWYLVVLALYATGLMAKPMLVSLPLVLLLLDYWPLQRLLPSQQPLPPQWPLPPADLTGPMRTSWWFLVMEKAPLALLSVAACVITFVVQHSTGAVGSFIQYPLGIRIANAALAYQNYLVHMVWPKHLACLYPYNLNLLFWKVGVAMIFLALVSVFCLWLWRRARYLIAGWLWYLITLVPVVGLVQVGNQAMADRYTYIPLIGIFIMIAWGVPDLVRRVLPEPRRRQMTLDALAVLACGSVVLLGIGTWLQAGTWKNTITVFEHAIAVTENNYLAHNNLANALTGRGRLDDAVYHYGEALRIKPDYVEVHNNIAVTLARQGKVDEAIYHYREALRMRPDCAEVYVNLGTILYNRQNLDEAAGLFAQAIRINPGLANAHYNLGVVLMQKGQLPDAVNHYVVALEIRPDMLEAYNQLILALVACGEYGKAMIAFRVAVRFYREWLPTLTGDLWLLASRQGLSIADRADLISMAEQTGRPMHSRDPAFLDALGVAYAGAGRFPEAIAVTRQALALMGVENQADRKNPVAQRLARYESQEPYFEEAVPTNRENVPSP
ncbi:MAG: tetratricopeptide repeat protein [Kiritimatiellaeota bacterium]|nr:tetratricopeptide repeat protein [Kiritimatiellota bacterium]